MELNEGIDLSSNDSEGHKFTTALHDATCTPKSSPKTSSNLISPIPIRHPNIDDINSNAHRISSELMRKYTTVEEGSDSIYSNVFKMSNMIGRKRRLESEYLENRSSLQSEFHKLLDVESTG